MKIWLDAPDDQRDAQRVATTGEMPEGKGNECECLPTTSHCVLIRSALDHTSLFCLARSSLVRLCAADRWLVCNPLSTGRVAVVDAEARRLLEFFQQSRTIDEAMRFFPELSSARLMDALQIFWELGLFQDSYEVVPNAGQPDDDLLTAWLHITNACNLRCQYCYVHKSAERMSEDTSLQAVDAIFRSAQRGGYRQVKIKYAGGEASLEMQRVLAVHDYAAQLARTQAIQLHGLLLSNGVVLTQRMIEGLKARRIKVTISLDGIGKFHDLQRPFVRGSGSFTRVDQSIQRLLTNQWTPSISVTISRRNLAGLPELMMYILEKDLPFTLNFFRDNDHVRHREELIFQEKDMIDALREAFQVLEKHLPRRSLLGMLLDRANLEKPHMHSCGAGQNYLVIDQRGGIAKCHAAQERSITTIAAPNPLRVIQNDRSGMQNLSVAEKEGCRTCTWRLWCGGGCPLLTYRVTGRNDLQSPNCQIYLALFPDVLRLEALRLLQYSAPFDLASRLPALLPSAR